MNEVLKFIYAIVLFQQAVFIIVLLLKSRLKTKQQVIVLLILLSLFFCATDRVINIYSEGLSRYLPWSIYILDTFNLLYLPLIYLFVKTISNKLWKPLWFELMHFAPFVYNLLLVLFCYTLKQASEQRLIRESFTKPGFFYTNQVGYYIIDFVRSLQIIYVIAALFLLYQFRRELKDKTSNNSTIVNYLIYILYSFIFLLWIGGLFFRSIIAIYFPAYIDILILITSSLFIYVGLKRPDELFGTMIFQNPAIPGMVKNYESSKLKLEDYIAQSKVYLDPEITLNNLAEQSGIPARMLSETINNCYQMHFFDFINSLRIEEAKKLLKQSNLTILEILFQVGFNSKSAFNRAFLKQTGVTPSEFRKAN